MTPYIAQIMPFGGNFAIRGWATCDGQLLAISQNTALFSLLGTTFGGDGRTTFGLPDLRGRSIVHVGTGPGLDRITWGERGGRIDVSLNVTNMANHTHTATSTVTINALDNGNASNETDSGGNSLGTGGSQTDIYREPGGAGSALGGVSAAVTVNPAGSSVPFNIRNPFLGIYVLIALTGIFPSRN